MLPGSPGIAQVPARELCEQALFDGLGLVIGLRLSWHLTGGHAKETSHGEEPVAFGLPSPEFCPTDKLGLAGSLPGKADYQ